MRAVSWHAQSREPLEAVSTGRATKERAGIRPVRVDMVPALVMLSYPASMLLIIFDLSSGAPGVHKRGYLVPSSTRAYLLVAESEGVRAPIRWGR